MRDLTLRPRRCYSHPINSTGSGWCSARSRAIARAKHKPDGLTRPQAESRLRDLIQQAEAVAPIQHARTLEAAVDAWIAHLEANGTKASSVRAYRAALDCWFLPTLKTRSLDRITAADVEHAMSRMRKAGLSDKTIRKLRRHTARAVQLRRR